MNELKKALGKTYYDILDVNYQNTISQLLERANELKLNSDIIKEISQIIQNEGTKTKDWGWNIINKKIDESVQEVKKQRKTRQKKSK